MSLIGQALGGAIAGIGTGAAQDIAAKRETALAELRAQREAQNISLKAGYDDARSEASDARTQAGKIQLLKYGTAADIAKDNNSTTNKARIVKVQGGVDLQLVGAKIQGEQALATLKANLDTRNDAQLATLKDNLESNNVKSVEQTADGRFFAVLNDGSTVTTKKIGEKPLNLHKTAEPFGLGDPTPAAAPAPIAGGGGGHPTPPSAAPAKQAIAAADLSRLYAQASAKAANGDPRFAGKSATQIKAIVDDGLRNKGYDIG